MPISVSSAARFSLSIRIPAWAGDATVDGLPAAAGSLHEVVVGGSGGATSVSVRLHPEVVVERGWGSRAELAAGGRAATPPADGVAFSRGALVFAHRPTALRSTTRAYVSPVPGEPNDFEIGTREAWNYAVDLASPPRLVRAPSAGWSEARPFATDELPFYLEVSARRLHAWGYWGETNITADLPASPVDCGRAGACGPPTKLRLVPFGATDIRISVFPWLNSSTGASAAAGASTTPVFAARA